MTKPDPIQTLCIDCGDPQELDSQGRCYECSCYVGVKSLLARCPKCQRNNAFQIGVETICCTKCSGVFDVPTFDDALSFAEWSADPSHAFYGYPGDPRTTPPGEAFAFFIPLGTPETDKLYQNPFPFAPDSVKKTVPVAPSPEPAPVLFPVDIVEWNKKEIYLRGMMRMLQKAIADIQMIQADFVCEMAKDPDKEAERIILDFTKPVWEVVETQMRIWGDLVRKIQRDLKDGSTENAGPGPGASPKTNVPDESY